jgi:hypothetical protein
VRQHSFSAVRQRFLHLVGLQFLTGNMLRHFSHLREIQISYASTERGIPFERRRNFRLEWGDARALLIF